MFPAFKLKWMLTAQMLFIRKKEQVLARVIISLGSMDIGDVARRQMVPSGSTVSMQAETW